MRALRGLLGLLVKLATFLALVVAVLRLFFVDAFVMPHNGMAPTLVYGEQVLVWRRAKPDLGDIVLCQHPRQADASVIGRVLAFAGHTVSTDGRGQLFVDESRASVEGGGAIRFFDQTREKMFVMRSSSIDYRGKHRHEFFVEEGTTFSLGTYGVEQGVYLLGDNRADSWNDSREFGEVDPSTCRGEIFMRMSPGEPRDDDLEHGWFEHVH